MQQTDAWLPEMSILEETTNVECKVLSIVCVSRGNQIWGVCIEMGTEPCVWLCAGGGNGHCINKRCINVGLNRATLGLFIGPHLQNSICGPHASTWGHGGSVRNDVTLGDVGKWWTRYNYSRGNTIKDANICGFPQMNWREWTKPIYVLVWRSFIWNPAVYVCC